MSNKPINPKQIDELSAIYDDYLHAVRQYQKIFHTYTVDNLACLHLELLYKDQMDKGQSPIFPWQVSFLNQRERQEFQDFLDEKIQYDTGHAYISSQHTNPAEDKVAPIYYVPDEFMMDRVDMQLPATVERYIVAYPEQALVGRTEFFVDGMYKATYVQQKNASIPLIEGFNKADVLSEFRILINSIDMYRKSNYNISEKFYGLVTNVYASEYMAPFENIILEILGSFAEKTQEICRDIYGKNPEDNPLQKAESDNLITSAADFQDYINIRNLMRHQWDTMDELGYFNSVAAQKNKAIRAEYLESYRRLCDKSLVQRMKSYVDVLHQLRHTYQSFHPDILVRDLSESNNKFISRVREFHRQNPDKDIVVELNHPLIDVKYQSLYNSLHKVLPQIKIKDDFNDKMDEYDKINADYQLRSWFLRTYNILECRMMSYCMMLGRDYRNKVAWDYFRYSKIIPEQDYKNWQKFTLLRNYISHNYFSPKLRQLLQKAEEPYLKSLNKVEDKLLSMYPEVYWQAKGVYKFAHPNGLLVTADFNTHKFIIEHLNDAQTQETSQTQTITPKPKTKTTKPYLETFSNGVEVTTLGESIVSVKLPNGIKVDMTKQTISWDGDAKWFANAENFNVLQTSRNKLFTDKNLYVTEFLERNNKYPIRGGDSCLMDRKHRATLDRNKRLIEFNYKNFKGDNIKMTFQQIKDGTMLSLPDDTHIIMSGNATSITHCGKMLTYENRREFAAGFTASQLGIKAQSPNLVLAQNLSAQTNSK